jgi:hypothetical protein
MYKRFSVLVIHSQKRAHRLDASFLAKIAVIICIKKFLFLRDKHIIHRLNRFVLGILKYVQKVKKCNEIRMTF